MTSSLVQAPQPNPRRSSPSATTATTAEEVPVILVKIMTEDSKATTTTTELQIRPSNTTDLSLCIVSSVLELEFGWDELLVGQTIAIKSRGYMFLRLLVTIAIGALVVSVHPISHFFTATSGGLALYIILIITPFIAATKDVGVSHPSHSGQLQQQVLIRGH